MANVKLGTDTLTGVNKIRVRNADADVGGGGDNESYTTFGVGSLPEGGNPGQILRKTDTTDYSCEWQDPNFAQTTGANINIAMSQKAVSDELTKIWAAINYVAPTIAEMSSTPRATSYKLPATFNLVSITHRETNAANIRGKLTLKRGSAVILTNIEPSETSVTISVTDSVQLLSSAITYTLSGTTIKGESISKSISVSGYHSSFIGASAAMTVSDSLFTELSEIESSSLSGTRAVNFASAPKYVWFISIRAISSIKSGGFDVPYSLVNSSYLYNTGSYKCYRTLEQVTTTENSFVIS